MEDEKKIPVIEVFGPTVQGEGAACGLLTHFIRFGLCSYRCSRCDSLHAVLPKEVKKNAAWQTQEELVSSFQEFQSQHPRADWVTLSGGDPCIHELSRLVHDLRHILGYKVALETQGILYKPWVSKCDLVTVSPKGPGMIDPDKFDYFVVRDFIRNTLRGFTLLGGTRTGRLCVKFPVFDDEDLDFVVEMYRKLTSDCPDLDANEFYLSLGNPYPPSRKTLNDDAEVLETGVSVLRGELARHYTAMMVQVAKRPDLRKMKFLPQLHVLLWGNRQGV